MGKPYKGSIGSPTAEFWRLSYSREELAFKFGTISTHLKSRHIFGFSGACLCAIILKFTIQTAVICVIQALLDR